MRITDLLFDMYSFPFLILIILIALVLLLAVFGPQIKGKIGEAKVALILKTLSKEHYRTINDVILPTRNGTTQIDHIVVSSYGIFVIETKNYKGLIYGGENSEKWTKNVWGNKYQFYNPLKQNATHVNALESILEIPRNVIVPIVVFSNSARLSVSTNQWVITLWNLRSVIKRYQVEIFSQEQVDDFVLKVELATVDDKDAKRAHVRNVQEKVYQKNQAIAHGICPRCGGQLVLRNGRYGSFYGCSNYPRCHFTLNNK